MPGVKPSCTFVSFVVDDFHLAAVKRKSVNHKGHEDKRRKNLAPPLLILLHR
jgi:hypothetical protein